MREPAFWRPRKTDLQKHEQKIIENQMCFFCHSRFHLYIAVNKSNVNKTKKFNSVDHMFPDTYVKEKSAEIFCQTLQKKTQL